MPNSSFLKELALRLPVDSFHLAYLYQGRGIRRKCWVDTIDIINSIDLYIGTLIRAHLQLMLNFEEPWLPMWRKELTRLISL